MNPSRLFILRPVATSLLMIALLVTGFIAYRLLPVSALPQVDYPTMQVVTFYPGASPELTTSLITSPLERQFGQMPGLVQMNSVSSAGASVVTLRFGLDISLDTAQQEVQAAINAAATLLPQELPVTAGSDQPLSVSVGATQAGRCTGRLRFAVSRRQRRSRTGPRRAGSSTTSWRRAMS